MARDTCMRDQVILREVHSSLKRFLLFVWGFFSFQKSRSSVFLLFSVCVFFLWKCAVFLIRFNLIRLSSLLVCLCAADQQTSLVLLTAASSSLNRFSNWMTHTYYSPLSCCWGTNTSWKPTDSHMLRDKVELFLLSDWQETLEKCSCTPSFDIVTFNPHFKKKKLCDFA